MTTQTLPKVDGRPPPHDLDAEAAVLVSALLQGTGAMVDELASAVQPDDFYSSSHQHIFEAMLALRASGSPVDVVQVGTWLKDQGRIGNVGGMAYIISLLTATAAPANALEYARTVREKSLRRALIARCQLTAAKGYVDPATLDELLAEHEKAVLELTTSRSSAKGFRTIGEIAREAYTAMRTHADRGGGLVGLSTGFTSLDDATGGLGRGDFSVVAARPGMGKTALILNLARNVAGTIDVESGLVNAVGLFELEMPDRQLGLRTICADASVGGLKARRAELTPEEWNAVTRSVHSLQNVPFYIDDSPALSMEDMLGSARRLRAELARKGMRLALVIADYIGLMAMDPGAERRDIAVGDVTSGMKRAAKALDTHWVGLSQLNRDVERRGDKRPQLADLRDSGAIEQDADNIFFLYRDDYYNPRSKIPGITELIIAKQRQGPCGPVPLFFDAEKTSFRSLHGAEWGLWDNRNA